MISYLKTLPIGNALRVYITPPSTAKYWRLLRRTADAFTGPDDAGAVMVADESTDNAILDHVALENGTTYYYRVYYFDGSTWTPSSTVSGAPAYTLEDESVDVQSLVRERIELSLANEVGAGVIRTREGEIEVLTAPPRIESTRFPVVSVHLSEDRPQERGIGDEIYPDQVSADGQSVLETEGWYARVSLDVIGWSGNAEERITLRQALKRAIVGNLQVFDAFGLIQIDYNQSDVEDFQSYGMPMYQTVDRFTCLAPVSIGGAVNVIRDVELVKTCEVTA